MVYYYMGLDDISGHDVRTVLFSASILEYFDISESTRSRNKVVTTILSFLGSAPQISYAPLYQIVYVIVLDGMLISTLHNPSVFDSIYATIVSCILEALADISISLVLVWKLKSIQSIRISTRKLLHKICLYVVAYGCITATSSVLVLVMWMVNINGYLSLTYFTGRIYSLTVLCNSIFVAGWRAEAAGFNDGNLTAADPPQDINGRRNKRRALNDIDFSLRLEIHSASAPEVAATSSSATFVPSSTIQVTNCGPLSSAGVV
ncbi:hypothetical protein D9757_004495 [Collybiopsis confluens]|uniref:DUF6534 domain-containing protein n=1 Tax=Collybiopsis confluens TaxID=2823264 RepID=A0A8H5HWG7_9AGAR|nr:hypothetical protein D9757_004495 [Collybiopsis confluens]